LDFTLNLLVYYGILKEGDAQCFELEASIAAGTYLLVPITAGLALLNTFVVKAYIQHVREKKDEQNTVSEDEKLRAFDRTTWDNRADAIISIRNPNVDFTDTFRWMLRSGDLRTAGPPGRAFLSDPYKIVEMETYSLAGTTKSDEEHGGESETSEISCRTTSADGEPPDGEASAASCMEN